MRTLGYTFISSDGYPKGNAVPTAEEARHIGRFNGEGNLYAICVNEFNATFLLLVDRKTEAKWGGDEKGG